MSRWTDDRIDKTLRASGERVKPVKTQAQADAIIREARRRNRRATLLTVAAIGGLILTAAILTGCGDSMGDVAPLPSEARATAQAATSTPRPTTTPAPSHGGVDASDLAAALSAAVQRDAARATAAAPVAVPPTPAAIPTPAPVVDPTPAVFVVIELHADFTPCQPDPGADVCEVAP